MSLFGVTLKSQLLNKGNLLEDLTFFKDPKGSLEETTDLS